jgi:glycosyltransferase involved in cell wall biosynthesis
MSALRALIKLALLIGVALAHLPLVLWSLARPRRGRAPRRDGVMVAVVPFEPGDRSGGARAVKDFVSLLARRYPVRVAIVTTVARPGAWRRMLGLALTWPLSLPSQCRSLVVGDPGVRAQLADADTVVFEFLSTALYLYLARPAAARLVLRDHEVLVRKTDMERRAAHGLEALVHAARLVTCYLVSYAVYRQADRIVTLTEEDRLALVSWFPFTAGRTVAIPVPFDEPARPPRPPAAAPVRDLVMVANFFHRPNVDALEWFVAECAPRLDPGFTLHVCGLDKPLDSAHLSPPATLTLKRHGFVDDIDAAAPEARIAVAPVVSGGGVRMKNLLLASMGKAVVTTRLGNEGIGFVDDRDAVVCDDGAEMARRVNALARAPEHIAALGASARLFVERHFGPEAVLAQLDRDALS